MKVLVDTSVAIRSATGPARLPVNTGETVARTIKQPQYCNSECSSGVKMLAFVPFDLLCIEYCPGTTAEPSTDAQTEIPATTIFSLPKLKPVKTFIFAGI